MRNFDMAENESKVKSTLSINADGSYDIYKTDSRAFWFVLGSLIFAIVAVYFYRKYPTIGLHYIFFATFAASSVIALRLVLFKKPVLNIDKNYITYYTILGTEEKILWDDVIGFKEIYDKKDHYIAILVQNAEAVVESQTNKILFKIMRLNQRAFETPYLISTNGLAAHPKDILNALNGTLEELNNRVMI